MRIINDYNNPNWLAMRKWSNGNGTHNGAWYYTHTLVDKLLPLVTSRRPADPVGQRFCYTEDHAVVWIHNNMCNPDSYKWLNNYRDLVLVCSVKSTAEFLKKMFPEFHVILLPLSIDIDEVRTHKRKKTKTACYAGNMWASYKDEFTKIPDDVDIFTNLPREELLDAVSEYKEVYAIGLTACEAKALGCKIKAFHSKYPDTKYWKVLDYKDAAKMLQEKLDKIDGVTNEGK